MNYLYMVLVVAVPLVAGVATILIFLGVLKKRRQHRAELLLNIQDNVRLIRERRAGNPGNLFLATFKIVTKYRYTPAELGATMPELLWETLRAQKECMDKIELHLQKMRARSREAVTFGEDAADWAKNAIDTVFDPTRGLYDEYRELEEVYHELQGINKGQLVSRGLMREQAPS